MTTDEKIAEDADVAARYLAALVARGIERAEAVTLTASYMGSRSIIAAQRETTDAVRMIGARMSIS